nr:uncharacterized protein LOC128703912 isoform X1 [Cherax quadricarinatus]
MEIQHYLRRTQGNMTKTPVAVGVLTHSMAEQHSLPNTPYKRAVADIVKLLKNETQKMNLTMEDLLPPVDQPYYQYSGSVPGSCSEETEWLVYEVEMNTTSELLHTLRMQSDVQSFFDMVQASSDIFYSNWSGASNGIKLQAAKMQPNEINETSSEMETPEANKNVMEPAEGTLGILMPVSNTVPIFPEATLVASEVISMSLQSVVPVRTRTQNTTLPFSTSRSTTHSNIDSLEKAPSSNGSSTNQLNKEMSHTAPSSELQTTTSLHTITPVDSGLESNFNMHANGTSSSSGLESPLVHTQTTETLGSQGMAPVPKLFAFVGVIVTIFFIL